MSGLADTALERRDLCPAGPVFDQGAQFPGDAGGPGRPYPPEDLHRLPQPVFCLGRTAGGQGAPAQAGHCAGLISGAADLAGQVQRLLVA
jgi:hypothetical protein